jgi:hypothetical protein
MEQTTTDLETMGFLEKGHERGKCAHILLLTIAQIVLTTTGWAQTISVLKPPQVRAKNHVVSLTLRAVN